VPIDDGVVIVRGDRIAAVGPRASTAIPDGARAIDIAKAFVTAGFQNTHVHFTDARWDDAAAQPASRLTAQLDAMHNRYGFTTVVDTASDVANTAALRRRIVAGEVAGPRILTAGWALYPPAGVPFYVRESLPPAIVARLLQPARPQDAVAMVRQNVDGGADLTKLFVGSWVERGRVLPMPVDIARAAVGESHRLGRLVIAHPSNVAGLEVALEAGVDILAHTLDDGRGLTPEHFARMRRQDVALVPTLKLFAGRWAWDVGDQLRQHARAGGAVLFGTDVGYLPDFDPADEYVLMASAGLGWRDVLASLTTAPAARFGDAASRGRIAIGLAADLVVLGSDPAQNPRAFADVRYTVRAGSVIYTRE
jgi:imidazolonepropionase-like amidohydrolase